MIIPKPGKPAYDTPKAFRPIVLLNTLGKLIEKIIARRLQFDAVKYGILHPNQLGGVAQWSTEDAGVFLTHLVQAGWVKGLKTSVVAFDIAQFFSSLNHSMLTLILRHFFFFFLNHQFVTRCSIAVRGRLSTTSSLQFWPQGTKTPLIGIETQLESIEFKEKSK